MRISQICLSNAAFIIKIINDPYQIRPHQKTIARTEILKDLTEPTLTLSGYPVMRGICAHIVAASFSAIFHGLQQPPPPATFRGS